ncbi:60S ribosomal protein L24 [Dionaea muscipula]
MAAMAALQGSLSSLSLSSSSFIGQSLSPSLSPPPVAKSTERPRSLIVARLKHWERKKCKPNSLPLLQKMHVKVGDTVIVIAGGDKGKVGEVTRIFKHNSTVIVSDINLKTKHVKSKEEGEPGEIIMITAPIHSSNVMLYSEEQNVASRVGHKVLEDGTKVRYLVKTGEIIDSADKWKEVIKNRVKTAAASS